LEPEAIPIRLKFIEDIMRNFGSLFSAVVAVSAILGTGAAAAADLPARTYTKAPAMVDPAVNWSGFYIGGDIGGVSQSGESTSNFFQTDPALANNFQNRSVSASSFTGGAHAGYNWQVAPSYVLGVEGDWMWMNTASGFCRQTDVLSAACTDNDRGFLTINTKTDWLSTIRGRVGWTAGNFMLYGTGGVAFADLKTSFTANCAVLGCASSPTVNTTSAGSSTDKTGWVVGAGVEWMFAHSWILRAEYLHADLGNVTSTFSLPAADCYTGGPCGATLSKDVRYDIGRVGVSYKFGGPVVARY
jgi:outer membrane immunogenic protein